MTTFQTLALAPKNEPVSLIVRHSARHPIEQPDQVNTAGLTEAGILEAEAFGGMLRKFFSPGKIITSPVVRCVDTAEAIVRGAGWQVGPCLDERLAHAFIESTWRDLPNQPEQPGLTPQIWELAALLLKKTYRAPVGLNLYITHDTVIAVLLAYLLQYPVGPSNWPDFLEGIAFWRSDSRIYAAWRLELYEITGRLKRFP